MRGYRERKRGGKKEEEMGGEREENITRVNERDNKSRKREAEVMEVMFKP